MFNTIDTNTLSMIYAFMDVYSSKFCRYDDLNKAIFLELLERSKNG